MSSYQAENLTERQWHFYQHKKEELKSAEGERHTVTNPKTFWSRWYILEMYVYRRWCCEMLDLDVQSVCVRELYKVDDVAVSYYLKHADGLTFF